MTKKILVAEDNDLIRRSYTMLFKNYGAAVSSAGNLKAALDFLDSENFDFIVSDGSYPLESGQEENGEAWIGLYNAAREKKYKPEKFILISGTDDNEEKAKERGVIYFKKDQHFELKNLVKTLFQD